MLRLSAMVTKFSSAEEYSYTSTVRSSPRAKPHLSQLLPTEITVVSVLPLTTIPFLILLAIQARTMPVNQWAKTLTV